MYVNSTSPTLSMNFKSNPGYTGESLACGANGGPNNARG